MTISTDNGVVRGLERPFPSSAINRYSPSQITAIVNTGDDTVLHGLHISPDLDTITYYLGECN